MGSKPKAEAPVMDLTGDLSKYVEGMSSALPQIFSQEQQFRPQFQGLNLGDIQSFLSGVDGQEGIFGLSRTAAQQAGMGLGEARGAELGQMTGQAGLTRGLMNAISPEQAGVVEGFANEAQRALAASKTVTPQERRGYEQTARESFAATGRLGGNANIVAEALGREDVLARKRAEAASAGQNAYNTAQGFYTTPGLSLLGTTPLAYQQGQNFLQQGYGAIGAGVPQLYDTTTGLNLGAAQRGNMVGASSANAQASASRNAGLMSAGGSIISAGIPIAASFI